MARRLYLLGMAAGMLWLGLQVAAKADVGAGVGASPIVLEAVAHPGHTYRLPGLYVINTGTVSSTYHIHVEHLSPGPSRTVPPAWVQFERNNFLLQPKESASVPMTLSIPADAVSGKYSSDLVAGTVAPSGSGPFVPGAEAATELRFQVGEGGFLWAWPWWAYAIAAMAVVAATAVGLQRRLGFRLLVERR